jgi:hypothetical protein
LWNDRETYSIFTGGLDISIDCRKILKTEGPRVHPHCKWLISIRLDRCHPPSMIIKARFFNLRKPFDPDDPGIPKLFVHPEIDIPHILDDYFLLMKLYPTQLIESFQVIHF